MFRPIPDDAVRVAALQNGEIDVAVNIPPHLADIIANHPRLFLSTAPSVRTIQLMYYTHQFDAQHKLVGPYQGPVADQRVRQAMNYAVDVDAVIRKCSTARACAWPPCSRASTSGSTRSSSPSSRTSARPSSS